jgi:hypothetical protein
VISDTIKDSEGTHRKNRTVISVSLFFGADLAIGADLYSGGAIQTVGEQLPDPQPHWYGHFGGVTDKQLEPLRRELQQQGYDELAYLAQIEMDRRERARRTRDK